MMEYRVLIADDEPIILSGIRHLIDWQSCDASIIGCVSNGAEALAIIEKEHPDIVITDIRMPVMDGLALAAECSSRFPDIVFIILTSLAEFSLAKEAIGFGISDYLLKTELDGDVLMKALLKAEQESRRRREASGRLSGVPAEDRLKSVISSLLIMRSLSQDIRSFLSESNVLDSFAFIASAFSFPPPSLEKQWSAEDYAKLSSWEHDIIGKILSSSPGTYWPVTPVAGKAGTAIYFVSGIDEGTWTAVAARIEERIASSSAMVTGLHPVLLRTPCMTGQGNLGKARSLLEHLMMAYYLGKDESSIQPAHLDVDPVFPRLEAAIASKDAVSCRSCFSVLRSAVAEADHSLGQFSFIVSAMHSAISSGLGSAGLVEDASVGDAFEAADYITLRSTALSFLEDAESSLLALIGSMGRAGSSVADKAREYVMMHITEKISLPDVAEWACVSPGYMSKSFKRIMGMSLVDYINMMKIGKAKEMMSGGTDDRIADIALALGFHNIYYFSKVFRKVEGMTPSEYMRKVSRG